MRENLDIQIQGHVQIVDDLGNVILDDYNAVHPQNMSRAIARALAGESNYQIFRIAFGNGGTETDAAYTITYREPNVGAWDTRLYHETFSKVVDETSPLLGQDIGSADSQTGTRPGGGAIPGAAGDNSVTSVEPDTAIFSRVIVKCTLGPNEPRGQDLSDYTPPTSNTEEDFAFDEIGLYTSGLPAIDTTGYQDIDVYTKTSMSDTGLMTNQRYSFNVAVDGNTAGVVSFTTPTSGGSGLGSQILYGDLCEAINTGSPAWQVQGQSALHGAKLTITDDSGGLFPSIDGAQTYGFLKVSSPTVGVGSTVNLAGADTEIFLANLIPQATLMIHLT